MSIDTDLNMFKNMIHVKVKGASHGDDLGYLFKIGNRVLKPGSIEEISVLRFVKMWTNFAKTGTPIPAKDSFLNSEWPPVTEVLNFLDIGTDLVAGVDPDIDRMKFWDELCKGVKECY
jgi:carboxylesterase type B